METFKGELVYTAITINDTKLAYKAGSKLDGQYYYTGRWANRGFTCSEALAKDFRNRNIAQLSIQESSYKRADPATGIEVDTPSATIMGYNTFTGAIALQQNLGDLEVAQESRIIKVKHAQKVALADLRLSPEMLQEVLAAL